MFLNISNHPVANWSESQVAAAHLFADQIADLRFPIVPPADDLQAIQQAADEFMRQVPTETTHAMVSGEYAMTVALVIRLQQRGIRCVVATTNRATRFDDEGNKISTFQFVRFRNYPTLASE